MSLFAPRDGFQVVASPEGAGGRLVHARTGDALALSAEEVEALARATTGGLEAGDEKRRALLQRFLDLRVVVEPKAAEATPPLPVVPAVEGWEPPPVPETEGEQPVPPAAATVWAVAATGPGGAGLWTPAASPPSSAATGLSATADRARLLSFATPRFRGDVKVVQRPESSLYDATHPQSGRTFQLYDFEVSLIRMLDGRRPLGEVLDAAVKLGIPVTLVSLNQFLRQLDRYGFLTPGVEPAAPKDQELWAPREQWDESLRTLFQSGTRLFRQGRAGEAVRYFEAMLEQSPDNPEAKEMLARAQEAAVPRPAPSSSFDELDITDAPEELAAPPGAPVPKPAAAAAPAPTAAAPAAVAAAPPSPAVPAAPRTAAAPPPTPAVPAAPQTAAAPKVVPPPPAAKAAAPRAARRPVVAVVALVLVAGGGAAGWYFTQPPTTSALPPLTTPVAVTPRPTPLVADAGVEVDAGERADDAGSAAAPVVADAGPTVAAPEDAGPVPAHDAGPPLDAGSATPAPDAGKPAPPDAGPAPAYDAGPAAASVDAGAPPALDAGSPRPADAGPARPAPVDATGWASFRIAQRGRVNMGDLVAPADGVLAWKAAPDQRVKKNEVVGTVTGASGTGNLTAANVGLLATRREAGAQVKQGEVVGAIPYFEAYAKAQVTGLSPTPDWRCEVSSEAQQKSAPCRITTAVPKGGGVFVTATVEARWFDDAADAVLRLAAP